jgi:hypothetical protein
MLEGLPYVAILLLLLLLLLVLFLILLFIFLFLLCASRLSTRQSKVDGTLGRKETALDFCIRAVSFRLSFVLPPCLMFLQEGGWPLLTTRISVSSRDWLRFRPAGPVDPDSTF